MILKTKLNSFSGLIVAALISLLLPSYGLASDTNDSDSDSPVVVEVVSVVEIAQSPAPPAGSKTGTKVGKGKATVNTSNASDDSDSWWLQKIDVDGDGNVEEVDLIWDNEDKMLFFYDEGDFRCASGGTAVGDLLIGVNGKGNARNRPAGSGFYLVTLDAGECAAEAAIMFGCKFGSDGNETVCGAAVIDEATDDIVISVSD